LVETERKCPQCASQGPFYKDGLRYCEDGSSVQRWLCRGCGYRFSEPNVQVDVSGKINVPQSGPKLLKNRVISEQFALEESLNSSSLSFRKNVVSNHRLTTAGKALNAFAYNDCKHQVCVSNKGAKNLSATETKTVAGDISQQDIKGKIIAYMWHLQKQGRCDGTIQGYRQKLTQLMREGVNLSDPESVKEYLAHKKQLENSKFYTMVVYDGFLKFLGVSWQKPNYRPTRRLPFLPTEDELNSLIACTGKTISTLLLLLKESGIRLSEALSLQWTDIDNERNVIILNTPKKHSEPRIFKVSTTLLGKLGQLPKTGNMIFANHLRQSVSQNFRVQRKRIAFKLGNPRLEKIHFHTLRHWKATMEYAKTRDILHVMQVLGHRNIKNTLIYTQLVKMEKEDNFYSATAKTATGAKDLVESGFEYVCTTPEMVMVFRKRK